VIHIGLYKEMHEILKEGQVGKFKLEKFTVTKENRFIMDTIPYGNYIRLTYNDECVMSNTPMETRTNSNFVYNANGDVLIAGLGLGLIVLAIQDKFDVKSITILEKYKEVIELVGNQLPLNEKVKIIESDCFTHEFPKGTKFDTIYFDIWSYVNEDVYEEMKELKKKYRKYKRLLKDNSNAFMDCWAEYQAKHNMRLI
jgi:spermidine synthase